MRWLLAACLFLLPTFADAATLVVSQSGSDSANCVSQPCRSVQRASDLAQPGDTVLVKDGTYSGFTVARSGETDRRIVFKAEHSRKARLTGTIKAYGKSHIVINGFDLRASSGNLPGNGIDLKGVATDIGVTDNAIYSTSESCVAAWGDPWQTDPARNNYRGLTDIRIVGNKAIKCNNGGSNEGITAANGVDGILIDSNEVGDVQGDVANGQYGGEGIDLKAGVRNARVLSNWVHDRPHICIYADGGGANGYYSSAPDNRNIEIAFNRITNCGDTAIQLSTEAAGNVSEVGVHDNLIEGTRNGFGVLVYRHPSSTDWARPLQPGCVKDATIKNNKIVNAARGPTKLDSSCSTGIVFTNNGSNVVPGTPPTIPPVEPPVEPPVACDATCQALKSDLAEMEKEAASIQAAVDRLEVEIDRAQGRLP